MKAVLDFLTNGTTPMDKVPMTAAGLKQLEDELRTLTNVERAEVIRAIATAREHGDLKENAEYHAARERQSFIEGRIAELKGVISHAEVIDHTAFDGNIIRFGATVMLADVETDQQITYQLVGEYEADIDHGRLSVSAPLARALIGKTLGDEVEVRTPGGSKGYEVVDVKFE